MEPVSLIHQAVLFAHLIAFAIALSAVLREDLALLRARRIDLPRLAGTARVLTRALAALWISGLALAAFDLDPDMLAFEFRPKLAAKLVVVLALTANGLALHLLAFPMLRGPRLAKRHAPALAVVLGAISTVSWLVASFIGAARPIAPWMRFADFMTLYLGLLAGAIAVALVFVRPHVARLLNAGGVEARSAT